jgi:hypothetical protein
MNRLLAHVRSNVVAYIALFVALGGTSYAAINLPAGSVGARQLRRGSVTETKLANRSVGAAKLDPKSIAGYVAFWAQISASGHLIVSSPRATVVTGIPAEGTSSVNWHRVISARCFALASVTNLPLGAAYANAYLELGGRAQTDDAVVRTFNGSGGNVPEPVNVAVVCP